MRCRGPGKVSEQARHPQGDGAAGGRGSPIELRNRRQVACPVRTLRPVRLAASTTSPATSARTAANPPIAGTSQSGCPPGSGGCTGTGTWAGVPLGMEDRSRASSRRTVASAVVCSCEARSPRRNNSWASVGFCCWRRPRRLRSGRGDRRGRRPSCGPGSWPSARPKDEYVCAFRHGYLRSINCWLAGG
jgi:hypothetical protein